MKIGWADAYITFLRKYLMDYSPDALLWVLAYGVYVHAIDDIVDKEMPTDKYKFMLQTFEFAEVVYTNIFYLQNIQMLRPLVKMASSSYITSVQLEGSSERWKQHASDSLRQLGNEIIITVIGLVRGINVRQEAALELQEIAYHTHHNELGEPV